MPRPASSATVLVVADLHLDLWKRTGRDPLDALPGAVWHGLDAVIVAGDLSNDPLNKWPRHLGRLVALTGPGKVHVIPGNHDYYKLGIDRADDLARLCTEAGASLALRRELHFGATRFLCATLWTDQALAGDPREGMDLHRIPGPAGRKLTAADLLACHREDLSWIEARLSTPWPGRSVVVTHHAPHPGMLSDHVPALFASDLGAVIARHAPALWLSGHTHTRTAMRLGETELRNISFGTPAEVPEGAGAEILRRGLLSCPAQAGLPPSSI